MSYRRKTKNLDTFALFEDVVANRFYGEFSRIILEVVFDISGQKIFLPNFLRLYYIFSSHCIRLGTIFSC